MRPHLTLLLLALAACTNPCGDMCDARADLIDRCSTRWELDYPALGWDDRAAFLSWCGATWTDALDSLSEDSEEWDQLADACRTDERQAEADVDCETLLD